MAKTRFLDIAHMFNYELKIKDWLKSKNEIKQRVIALAYLLEKQDNRQRD